MKKVALFGVAGVLALAGMIRIDLAAQVSAEGRPKDSKPPGGAHYRVLPVQTDLQRLILGKDVSVFVTLDLTGVVKDAEPDQAALRSIRRDLAGAGARAGIVYFRIFHDKTADSHENKRLHDALRGLARAEGFRGSKVDEERRNDALTWRDLMRSRSGRVCGWRGSMAWRSRSDSREAGSRMGVDAIAESVDVQGPFIDVIVLGKP